MYFDEIPWRVSLIVHFVRFKLRYSNYYGNRRLQILMKCYALDMQQAKCYALDMQQAKSD